ncbi:MAG TPA: ATP-dependent helicase HrpB [Arcobacter sp.]|nr:ATP-dependent helicase HrpB [Arcobacter sp.]
MSNLPINEVLDDIKSAFQTNHKLILQAPPGAGKSTAVPISFLKESWIEHKIIIMLEPRRVAVRMVASRMAELLGEKVGETIGYTIKMESVKSSKTKVLVVTEAVLVRMIQSDQELSNVAMVIFDEYHERSIHTDLSLALCLQSQELLREDLKILLMSATLNEKELTTLLPNTPVITSKGRLYEVENIYLQSNILQPNPKTINTLLLKTILNSIKNDSGDILVFLAGLKEIKNLQKSLSQNIKEDIQILPLYSSLSKKEQDKAIKPSSTRKIILSTNISQTSLTIKGVKVVVDSGYEKLSRFNYNTSMNHLELSFISKDSAIQRGGRAGRIEDGKCYKLWHKAKILEQSTKPEILRSDLSSLILDLSLWGVDEFEELTWMDIPSEKIINETKEVLNELQMLDDGFKITSFGKEALSLGVHPRFSYMILKAHTLGYAYEACMLASILEQKDIFNTQHKSSDIKERFIALYENNIHTPYINTFVAKDILKQTDFYYSKLKKIKKIQTKKDINNYEIISVLLLFAYPDRLAKIRKKDDVKYKLSNAKGAILDIEDTLYNEEYLCVANLNAANKDSYINLAGSICLNDIEKYFKHLIKQNQSITYNKDKNRLDIKEHTTFLNLELYNINVQNQSNIDFEELILKLLEKEGLSLLFWSKKAIALQDKINYLNNYDSNLLEIDFSNKWLKTNLYLWIKPYLKGINTITKLQDLDVYNILLGLINWNDQQTLEQLLPTSIKVPSGSNIYIDYSNINTAVLSVKIQEMFGLMNTPKILNNTIDLQIHLLSPAKKPIQITYDIKSFWENSYGEVRKELRGKYKRHYWPEDPYEAIATAKTKKHMMKGLE